MLQTAAVWKWQMQAEEMTLLLAYPALALGVLCTAVLQHKLKYMVKRQKE